MVSVAQVKPNAAKLKNDLLVTLLCQLMMQIISRRLYFFPSSLSVGIFLHQTIQSRVFLEALSSLGLYASYSKVMECEQAAGASRTSSNDTLNSLSVESNINFCRWVADRFYFNLDTIYGMGQTYAIGIISCISLKIDFARNFKTASKKTSPMDVRSKLSDLQMKKVSEKPSIHRTSFYMHAIN